MSISQKIHGGDKIVSLFDNMYVHTYTHLNKMYVSGNALAQVQRVHKPADLWDITFCTR